MSVEQRKVVDFIGTCKSDGHIILTIADHLPFDGGDARLIALQDKLNDYLTFLESGEVCDTYPAANGRPIEISIRFKYAPDERGICFLRTAEQTIREAGFRLTYEAPHE
jgi:hypothetical protein